VSRDVTPILGLGDGDIESSAALGAGTTREVLLGV
jgi:hypothetical protein